MHTYQIGRSAAYAWKVLHEDGTKFMFRLQVLSSPRTQSSLPHALRQLARMSRIRNKSGLAIMSPGSAGPNQDTVVVSRAWDVSQQTVTGRDRHRAFCVGIADGRNRRQIRLDSTRAQRPGGSVAARLSQAGGRVCCQSTLPKKALLFARP